MNTDFVPVMCYLLKILEKIKVLSQTLLQKMGSISDSTMAECSCVLGTTPHTKGSEPVIKWLGKSFLRKIKLGGVGHQFGVFLWGGSFPFLLLYLLWEKTGVANPPKEKKIQHI